MVEHSPKILASEEKATTPTQKNKRPMLRQFTYTEKQDVQFKTLYMYRKTRDRI